MDIPTFMILVLIGLMAGVFSGVFGVGGALVMVPALVYFLGVSQHTAQGTSLAVMLPPIGLFAAYNYYKAGQVNIWFAVIIAATFLVGGYVGSKISLSLNETTMKRVFGLLLLLVAMRLILTRSSGPGQ